MATQVEDLAKKRLELVPALYVRYSATGSGTRSSAPNGEFTLHFHEPGVVRWTTPVAPEELPAVLSEFMKRHPGLEIRYHADQEPAPDLGPIMELVATAERTDDEWKARMRERTRKLETATT